MVSKEDTENLLAKGYKQQQTLQKKEKHEVKL